MDYIIEFIASELSLKSFQVKAVLQLIEGGATIPFIARYRKEATGNLDEEQIMIIKKRNDQLIELEKRRKAILKSLIEQEKLTDKLQQEIDAAQDLTDLEDIYLPYKPKRKTRASIAIGKGLEPLARIIMTQVEYDIFHRAGSFINKEKGVENEEAALQGARDIIAEWVSENRRSRAVLRKIMFQQAEFKSTVIKGKEDDGEKYSMYFDWVEQIKKVPSHRILAMFRAENEGIIKLQIAPEKETVINALERIFIKSQVSYTNQIKEAINDSYKRLLLPSIENEVRKIIKELADEKAIKVFSENLRQLLMEAPLGQKRVLAIDPGFRTGCKVVCLDSFGNIKHNETIYPHPPQKDVKGAVKKIKTLVNAYKIEAIAIGNGTAGRETEALVKRIKFDQDLIAVMVNENGASVYSASSIARKEFPQYDVTVRGSISIGRRLIDPLAELVKIDPKSIGVGQYQHDVDQKLLAESLDFTVMSCVNAVGVEVNTASEELLAYVSGVGPVLAKNIVDYRKENGQFKSRSDLKKVNRFGPKVFEQAAGFLRIRDGENPLDQSAVHPESYKVVQKMAKAVKCDVAELIRDHKYIEKIKTENFVTDKIGLHTINDIIEELKKPGRDPREKFGVFDFSSELHKIEDLIPGMIVPGIINNITAFGAFVDIGIHENGLIHVSEIADEYVKDPMEYLQIHQKLDARIVSVDIPRKRIQLSLKGIKQKWKKM